MVFFVIRVVLFLLFIGIFSAYYNFTTLGKATSLSHIGIENISDKTARFSEEELVFFDSQISEIVRNRQFNGQILVARDGNILFNQSFGVSDFRNAVPINHQTQFQIASITKTFTAAAVLLLQQRGLIHIDSLVTRYMPDFPYPNIRVRNLLNHTSGLQNYMWVMEQYWNQDRLATNEDMLRTFVRQKRPLDFAPGTRFAYSNTGYAFLALLIERVSGTKFSMFMQQNIFEPLQMHNTLVFDPSNGFTPANRASGFRNSRRGRVIIGQSSHDGITGDKGIFSTAADLFIWDRAIATNQLLSNQEWSAAFERSILANQNTVDYGLGWRLHTFLNQRIVHHPGRWSGFRTSFKRFIDSDATLIVLANNNVNIVPMVSELQQVLFHRELASNLDAQIPEEPELELESTPQQ